MVLRRREGSEELETGDACGGSGDGRVGVRDLGSGSWRGCSRGLSGRKYARGQMTIWRVGYSSGSRGLDRVYKHYRRLRSLFRPSRRRTSRGCAKHHQIDYTLALSRDFAMIALCVAHNHSLSSYLSRPVARRRSPPTTGPRRRRSRASSPPASRPQSTARSLPSPARPRSRPP